MSQLASSLAIVVLSATLPLSLIILGVAGLLRVLKIRDPRWVHAAYLIALIQGLVFTPWAIEIERPHWLPVPRELAPVRLPQSIAPPSELVQAPQMLPKDLAAPAERALHPPQTAIEISGKQPTSTMQAVPALSHGPAKVTVVNTEKAVSSLPAKEPKVVPVHMVARPQATLPAALPTNEKQFALGPPDPTDRPRALAAPVLKVVATSPGDVAIKADLAAARPSQPVSPSEPATASLKLSPTKEHKPELASSQPVQEVPATHGWAAYCLSGIRRIAAPLGVIWLIGVGWGMFQLVLELSRLRRLAESCRPVPLDWQQQVWRIAAQRGLQRIPRVLTHPTQGPLLCPAPGEMVLVLPAQLWPKLSEQERELVLLHELAHFMRRDLWWLILARLVVILHWFNPLAWRAARQLEEAAEWACDAWTTQLQAERAIDLAKALLQFLERDEPKLALVSAMGGASMKTRFERLVSGHFAETPLRRYSLVAVLFVATILGICRWQFVDPLQFAMALEGPTSTGPDHELGELKAPNWDEESALNDDEAEDRAEEALEAEAEAEMEAEVEAEHELEHEADDEADHKEASEDRDSDEGHEEHAAADEDEWEDHEEVSAEAEEYAEADDHAEEVAEYESGEETAEEAETETAEDSPSDEPAEAAQDEEFPEEGEEANEAEEERPEGDDQPEAEHNDEAEDEHADEGAEEQRDEDSDADEQEDGDEEGKAEENAEGAEEASADDEVQDPAERLAKQITGFLDQWSDEGRPELVAFRQALAATEAGPTVLRGRLGNYEYQVREEVRKHGLESFIEEHFTLANGKYTVRPEAAADIQDFMQEVEAAQADLAQLGQKLFAVADTLSLDDEPTKLIDRVLRGGEYSARAYREELRDRVRPSLNKVEQRLEGRLVRTSDEQYIIPKAKVEEIQQFMEHWNEEAAELPRFARELNQWSSDLTGKTEAEKELMARLRDENFIAYLFTQFTYLNADSTPEQQLENCFYQLEENTEDTGDGLVLKLVPDGQLAQVLMNYDQNLANAEACRPLLQKLADAVAPKDDLHRQWADYMKSGVALFRLVKDSDLQAGSLGLAMDNYLTRLLTKEGNVYKVTEESKSNAPQLAEQMLRAQREFRRKSRKIDDFAAQIAETDLSNALTTQAAKLLLTEWIQDRADNLQVDTFPLWVEDWFEETPSGYVFKEEHMEDVKQFLKEVEEVQQELAKNDF